MVQRHCCLEDGGQVLCLPTRLWSVGDRGQLVGEIVNLEAWRMRKTSDNSWSIAYYPYGILRKNIYTGTEPYWWEYKQEKGHYLVEFAEILSLAGKLCWITSGCTKNEGPFLCNICSTQSNSTQLNWVKSDNDYWCQPPPYPNTTLNF